MSTNDVLSQEEIDMLLRGSDDADAIDFNDGSPQEFAGDDTPAGHERIRPYDPATQHRVI